MVQELSQWGNALFIIGLGFYAYGSTKYRLPHAPVPFNGPRGWPWAHHDWFALKGLKYRRVGLWLGGLGMGLQLIHWLPIS